VNRFLKDVYDANRYRALTHSRHPEARAKRASKGDGPARADILRGPLRGHLRMTVNIEGRYAAASG
jgi:hypothetical protein